jgi:hypothetical protein
MSNDQSPESMHYDAAWSGAVVDVWSREPFPRSQIQKVMGRGRSVERHENFVISPDGPHLPYPLPLLFGQNPSFRRLNSVGRAIFRCLIRKMCRIDHPQCATSGYRSSSRPAFAPFVRANRRITRDGKFGTSRSDPQIRLGVARSRWDLSKVFNPAGGCLIVSLTLKSKFPKWDLVVIYLCATTKCNRCQMFGEKLSIAPPWRRLDILLFI